MHPEILTHINGIPIKRNFISDLPYNPDLKTRANHFRKAGILSEVLFWMYVHKGEFHTIDFDRQRVIGNYIVDFYVKALGLVVEIDGSSHDEKEAYDQSRQNYLESLGCYVHRVKDIDVKLNISLVLENLETLIINRYGVK